MTKLKRGQNLYSIFYGAIDFFGLLVHGLGRRNWSGVSFFGIFWRFEFTDTLLARFNMDNMEAVYTESPDILIAWLVKRSDMSASLDSYADNNIQILSLPGSKGYKQLRSLESGAYTTQDHCKHGFSTVWRLELQPASNQACLSAFSA